MPVSIMPCGQREEANKHLVRLRILFCMLIARYII